MSLNGPLYLQPRKASALFGLIAAVALSLAALFSLPTLVSYLARNGGWIPILATGLVVIALGCTAAVHCVRQLAMEGPALVLDKQGLTDRRNNGIAMRWDHIESINLETTDGDRLVIRIRDDALQNFKISKLSSRLRRMIEGGELTVSLGSVRYDRRSLEGAISGYLQTSAQIRAARSGATHTDQSTPSAQQERDA